MSGLRLRFIDWGSGMSLDLLLRRRAVATTRRRGPVGPRSSRRTVAEMPDWVEAAKALPDVRWDKVARIREALDAGSYDVDARLNDLLADLPDELALLRRTGS